MFSSGATLASAPSRLERIYVEGPRIAAIDRDRDGQLGGHAVGRGLKTGLKIGFEERGSFLHFSCTRLQVLDYQWSG